MGHEKMFTGELRALLHSIEVLDKPVKNTHDRRGTHIRLPISVLKYVAESKERVIKFTFLSGYTLVAQRSVHEKSGREVVDFIYYTG